MNAMQKLLNSKHVLKTKKIFDLNQVCMTLQSAQNMHIEWVNRIMMDSFAVKKHSILFSFFRNLNICNNGPCSQVDSYITFKNIHMFKVRREYKNGLTLENITKGCNLIWFLLLILQPKHTVTAKTTQNLIPLLAQHRNVKLRVVFISLSHSITCWIPHSFI